MGCGLLDVEACPHGGPLEARGDRVVARAHRGGGKAHMHARATLDTEPSAPGLGPRISGSMAKFARVDAEKALKSGNRGVRVYVVSFCLELEAEP